METQLRARRDSRAVSLETIKAAAKRIEGVAIRTPLVKSPALSRIVGCNVFLKLECYQPIRVFKIRGAYNKISQLKNASSIVAASSGNHGIAVSYSSNLLGKKCTVVVPENAVLEKLAAISEFGAEVVKFGKFHTDREKKAVEISEKTGAVFVRPFNDVDVMSGQGTAGLEILEDLPDVDTVIVPIGGGGLIAGIACAVKESTPKRQNSVKVLGVEPNGATSMYESLKQNRIVELKEAHSIADGLIPTTTGDLTFDLCKRYVDEVLLVSDEEILAAMRLLLKEAHVLAEPSGAASLAGLVNRYKLRGKDENVVIVISGGNVSLKLLQDQISKI